MELGLLIIRLFLAVVFGVAGAAKLSDRIGSEKAMRDFGVPDALNKPFALLLPVVEISIAVGLLVYNVSWLAAIGASILLLIFSVGMIYQLGKGNAPDCHCFGQLHSEPVGKISILRNIGLLILSSILVMRGQNGQGNMWSEISRSDVQILIGLAVIAMIGGLAGYLRRVLSNQDLIIRRLDMIELITGEGGTVKREEAGNPQDGLPIGAPFPVFSLPDTNGRIVTLESLLGRGLPVLMFFVSPTCGPCKALVPQFDEWQKALGQKATIVFLSNGNPDENLDKFAGSSDKVVLLQKDRELADIVLARWTPSVMLIGSDGRIASHVAVGDSAIHELVRSVDEADLNSPFIHFTTRNNDNQANKIGQKTPEFEVLDFRGRTLTEKNMTGKPTLVTFWGVNCPHCEVMKPALIKWANERSNGDPNLIIFTNEPVGDEIDADFEAMIVVDKNYKTADQLGMSGTPSAILVNENGIIVSEIAIGASNIWALLGKRI